MEGQGKPVNISAPLAKKLKRWNSVCIPISFQLVGTNSSVTSTDTGPEARGAVGVDKADSTTSTSTNIMIERIAPAPQEISNSITTVDVEPKHDIIESHPHDEVEVIDINDDQVEETVDSDCVTEVLDVSEHNMAHHLQEPQSLNYEDINIGHKAAEVAFMNGLLQEKENKWMESIASLKVKFKKIKDAQDKLQKLLSLRENRNLTIVKVQEETSTSGTSYVGENGCNNLAKDFHKSEKVSTVTVSSRHLSEVKQSPAKNCQLDSVPSSSTDFVKQVGITLSPNRNKIVGEGRKVAKVDVQTIIQNIGTKTVNVKGNDKEKKVTIKPVHLVPSNQSPTINITLIHPDPSKDTEKIEALKARLLVPFNQSPAVSYANILVQIGQIVGHAQEQNWKETSISINSIKFPPAPGPIFTLIKPKLPNAEEQIRKETSLSTPLNLFKPPPAQRPKFTRVKPKPDATISLTGNKSCGVQQLQGSSGSDPKMIVNTPVLIEEIPEVSLTPMCEKCKTRTAIFVCAVCSMVNYCSKFCQSKDWGKHREVCDKIKLSKTIG